ncbi:hypothetical protein Tcan_09442 [Toxocara canis]|uniref:Uncharacterized protein n=1 Tax=Toxocara canis TaxID=6265 RepID=A0A0B2W2K8_TOXCA|nr:hypothetical protein Tcan_09442 [Toxocara canis]
MSLAIDNIFSLGLVTVSADDVPQNQTSSSNATTNHTKIIHINSTTSDQLIKEQRQNVDIAATANERERKKTTDGITQALHDTLAITDQTKLPIVEERRVTKKSTEIPSTLTPSLPQILREESSKPEQKFDDGMKTTEGPNDLPENPLTKPEIAGMHAKVSSIRSSNRIVFFGISGVSLLAAAVSATIFCLVCAGKIMTPHRKPTPPNVLPPAAL